MADHVYKHIRLTGSSTVSIEEAIQNAIDRAEDSVENLRWFEVKDTRGHIEEGTVKHWQVTIEVGFTLKETVG
ncbi:dodecin [Longibacter sp.]|uniref:dodecin n=1 Tax=Longibacter sp. TaxID=2045415 RepID=UPI003EB7B25A